MPNLRLLCSTTIFVFVLSPPVPAAVVCHIPPGNPANQHTLVISDNAAPAHLSHGDSLGACGSGCTVVSCEYTPLEVRYQAKGKMDGSAKRPFGSLSRALAYAGRQNLACVELKVGEGFYAEDPISIYRNTKITGVSPGVTIATEFTNLGPFALAIGNAMLTASDGSAGAAIEVKNQCAHTALNDVLIDDIEGNAVNQSGGTIEMNNVTVRRTRQSNVATSGIGVFLDGGVHACLAGLNLNDNAVGGLLAIGIDTQVLLYDSLAERNGGSMGLSTGGLTTLDGALLLGQNVTLNDNVLDGVRVDRSARAHLRDVSVSRTQAGSNVKLGDVGAGILNLTSFALCQSTNGALITSAGSTLRLQDGEIGYHLRGIFDQSGPDASEICKNNVQFTSNQDNEVPIPIFKPQVEFACENGEDDDADGFIDFCDTDCIDPPMCDGTEICNDSIDNDGNNLIDCDDSVCDAFCTSGGNGDCTVVGFEPSWCDVSLSPPSTSPECPTPPE